MKKPKLIIINGPPAAGKLTVAKALAKKTGFKIFHNHLTIDATISVLPSDSKRGRALRDLFREKILEACAKDKVPGVIFTYVYAYGFDDAFVTRIIRVFEKAGGAAHLVHLVPEPGTLMQRVKEPTRKSFRKIKTKTKLSQIIKKYELYRSYRKRPALIINNTNSSAGRVAAQIAKHYKLN